jgi:hypothetical protein
MAASSCLASRRLPPYRSPRRIAPDDEPDIGNGPSFTRHERCCIRVGQKRPGARCSCASVGSATLQTRQDYKRGKNDTAIAHPHGVDCSTTLNAWRCVAAATGKTRKNYFCCTLQLTSIAFDCFRLQLDLGSLNGRCPVGVGGRRHRRCNAYWLSGNAFRRQELTLGASQPTAQI